MSFVSNVTPISGSDIMTTSVVLVTVTAVQILPANELRREVMLTKTSNKELFIGEANTVTVVNGMSFAGGSGSTMVLTTKAAIFGVRDGGGSDPALTVLELSDL